VQGLFQRTFLTPGSHQSPALFSWASYSAEAFSGQLLLRSGTRSLTSASPTTSVPHLASRDGACHCLGRWLISAWCAGWVPWSASTGSHSNLTSIPGRSCQSGSSCSRHLPGAVAAGGDASQVLRLSTNSTVFVESIRKVSFAVICIRDAFFCLNSFLKYC